MSFRGTGERDGSEGQGREIEERSRGTGRGTERGTEEKNGGQERDGCEKRERGERCNSSCSVSSQEQQQKMAALCL